MTKISYIFVSLFFTINLFGQMGSTTIKKSEDFEVNGKGNHQNWEMTDWITLTQRSNTQVDYSTKTKVLYSEKGIYFLFECEDKKIISTIREDNADLWEEDVVEVFFWTDEQHPFYFEYELSPYNFELPILVPNVDGDFLGWLPWHYEGDRKTRKATDIIKEDGEVRGWRAEFFIPFALLKPMSNVPPQSGTKWRANMYRIDYDKGMATWTWQPIRTNFHDYQRFGTFIFE